MRTEEGKKNATATQARYDKTHTKQVKVKLNLKTDADILDWLQNQSNVQGYLKQLIRNDIASQQ